MKRTTHRRSEPRSAALTSILEIHDLNHRGQGVGRLDDGRVAFVTGALPGEKVAARLTILKKNYASGAVEEILTPSPHRVTPPCPWMGQCGGCQLGHCDYEGQLAFKARLVQSAFTKIGRFGDQALSAPAVHPSLKTLGYRNKASFPITPWGVGFYAAGSHRLVPVDCCLLLTPALERCYQTLRPLIEKSGLPPYDERTGRGLLRHLVLREGSEGLYGLLVLNGGPEKARAVEPLAQAMRAACADLAGMGVNLNAEAGNRILTAHTLPLWGTQFVTQELDFGSLTHEGTAFFQVNLLQARRLFSAAASFLEGGEQVLELFCGVGALTGYLAQRTSFVKAVEIWPPAVEQARENARRLGLKGVEFLLSAAEQLDEALFDGPEAVVVDPPRSGLAPSLIPQLRSSTAQKLIYVSCDPATLARDVAALTSAGPGAFRLERLECFDLFPQTAHVETVVLLSKLNTK